MTREEHLIVKEIVQRMRAHDSNIDCLELSMDISAVHCNSCKLKLAELSSAPQFDFVHDIRGIQRHLNRQTGQLEDCFLPRYAA